jgi:hypothetical protein
MRGWVPVEYAYQRSVWPNLLKHRVVAISKCSPLALSAKRITQSLMHFGVHWPPYSGDRGYESCISNSAFRDLADMFKRWGGSLLLLRENVDFPLHIWVLRFCFIVASQFRLARYFILNHLCMYPWPLLLLMICRWPNMFDLWNVDYFVCSWEVNA